MMSSTPEPRPPSISRRAVARTGAWLAPVVLAGAAAPVALASPGCPPFGCWNLSGTPTYTVSRAGVVVGNSSADSLVTLNIGWVGLRDESCTLPDAYYYGVEISSIVGIDQSGVAWTGSAITGGSLNYGDIAGGAWGPTVTFTGFATLPAPFWDPSHRLTRFVITYDFYLYGFWGVLEAPLVHATACSLVIEASCVDATNCGQGGLTNVA